MKIFISWSGERSQTLAQALRDWLPMVLYFSDAWLSNADIEAGERWATRVAKELEATEFGLICITKENINSPWILFEAGALAKSMQEGRVVPLLLDVDFKDIAGPLAQFQAKKFDENGLQDVVKSINHYAQNKLQDTRLQMQFDALWPALEAKISIIPKSPSLAKSNRPQSEVLEELVTSVRGLDLRVRDTMHVSPRARRRHLRFHPMLVKDICGRIEANHRNSIKYLLTTSFLREDYPWLYDLALEAFRSSISGNAAKYREDQRRFLVAFDVLRRGPFLEIFDDKESIHLVREIYQMFETLDSEIIDESTNRRSKGVLEERDKSS